MMAHRTPHLSNSKVYEDYYCNQVGHGLPVYVGGRNYRGGGLGNILGGIGRAIIPLLKSGGRTLLKEGAKTALHVGQDLLSGENIASSVKRRSKQAGKRMFHRAVNHVTGIGGGQPVRKRIRTSSPSKKRQTKPRKQVRKKKKNVKRRAKDIFD